jgi:hypothetical protein
MQQPLQVGGDDRVPNLAHGSEPCRQLLALQAVIVLDLGAGHTFPHAAAGDSRKVHVVLRLLGAPVQAGTQQPECQRGAGRAVRGLSLQPCLDPRVVKIGQQHVAQAFQGRPAGLLRHHDRVVLRVPLAPGMAPGGHVIGPCLAKRDGALPIFLKPRRVLGRAVLPFVARVDALVDQRLQAPCFGLRLFQRPGIRAADGYAQGAAVQPALEDVRLGAGAGDATPQAAGLRIPMDGLRLARVAPEPGNGALRERHVCHCR